MRHTFLTFILSLFTYAIITLPVIGVPAVYGYSLLLAAGFGLAAWVIFTLIFIKVKSLDINTDLKWLLLVLAIPIGVAVGYTLIGVFGVWKDVWKAGWLMLFPLAGTVSGWIGLYKTRMIIGENINPISHEYLIY